MTKTTTKTKMAREPLSRTRGRRGRSCGRWGAVVASKAWTITLTDAATTSPCTMTCKTRTMDGRDDGHISSRIVPPPPTT